jgi:putative endonuclease
LAYGYPVWARSHRSSWSAKADHPRVSFVAAAIGARHDHWVAGGWVTIMTNRPDSTHYVGVTADLPRRAWEHRAGAIEGFTKRYGLKRLVYAERHEDIREAVRREKTIKRWRCAWKVRLIRSSNPDWADIYDTLI